jgi:hypothetical protein
VNKNTPKKSEPTKTLTSAEINMLENKAAEKTKKTEPIKDIIVQPKIVELTVEEEKNDVVEELIPEKKKEEVINPLISIPAPYKNPKTDVDMVINYRLDQNNRIESINATATTFDMDVVNGNLKTVI